MKNEFLQTETDILQVLKQIYDPEIPVNIYDLGLIYEINVDEDNHVRITMTLTAPNCPIADQILEEVEQKVGAVKGVASVKINLTFDPPWDQSMLTEEAKLELGLL
jgi:FeS assembly SUF system protein